MTNIITTDKIVRLNTDTGPMDFRINPLNPGRVMVSVGEGDSVGQAFISTDEAKTFCALVLKLLDNGQDQP